MLVAHLQSQQVPVLATHEPGGTPLGDQIRQLVLLRDDLSVGARTEALLMCSSRAQLVDTVIRPALDRGEVVVCDRFSPGPKDRKSTRLNSSHTVISYAV